MEALGKTPRRGCALHALGYLALALALGLAGAREVRSRCGGELVPPLDDTYIHLQYARAAADGRPLEYQPGAAPTRGATSLLYPLVLAPFARVLTPGALPWAAWGLGTLFLALAALAADRWAARRLGPGAAWAAGLGVLATGPFVWGALSGMETGLMAASLAGSVALAAWYQDAPGRASGLRRLAVLAAVLAALAFTRPEGILLAAWVAVAVALAGRAPNSARARWALVLVPAAAAAVGALVDLAAFGRLGTNSLEAKAVWSEFRPDVREAVFRRLPWVLGQITGATFTAMYDDAYGPVTGYLLRGLLGLGGALGAARAVVRGGLAERVLLGAVVLALLAGLIPVGFRSHHYRYQQPLLPLAVCLAVLGWSWILARGPRLLRVAAVLGGLALLAPGTARYLELYGRNAFDIHRHQVAAGRWIDRNLPPDAVVGINDAGAIPYFGNRRVVDLVGLVTNGSALPHRSGEAGLFEWLQGLPPQDRPTHFAVFPGWFPYLTATSLVGEALVRFHVPDRTITGGDTKAVYRADWTRALDDGRPVARAALLDLWGFTVSDRLDVADLDSEAAHGWEPLDTWRSTLREFPAGDRDGPVLIDGGKKPTRGERFRLACRPGEPAALVLRTEAFVPFTLRVFVDDEPVGVLEIPAAPQVWTEPMLEIPGEALRRSPAGFRVEVEGDLPYPVYGYWLLQ